MSASVVPSAAVILAAVAVAPSAVLSTALKALILVVLALHAVGQAFLGTPIFARAPPDSWAAPAGERRGRVWARIVRAPAGERGVRVRMPAAWTLAVPRCMVLHGPRYARAPLCKGPAVARALSLRPRRSDPPPRPASACSVASLLLLVYTLCYTHVYTHYVIVHLPLNLLLQPPCIGGCNAIRRYKGGGL